MPQPCVSHSHGQRVSHSPSDATFFLLVIVPCAQQGGSPAPLTRPTCLPSFYSSKAGADTVQNSALATRGGRGSTWATSSAAALHKWADERDDRRVYELLTMASSPRGKQIAHKLALTLPEAAVDAILLRTNPLQYGWEAKKKKNRDPMHRILFG